MQLASDGMETETVLEQWISEKWSYSRKQPGSKRTILRHDGMDGVGCTKLGMVYTRWVI